MKIMIMCFCYICIIIGILIYLEIIIVHVCKMDENTQKGIDNRAEKDVEYIDEGIITEEEEEDMSKTELIEKQEKNED